MNFRDQYDLWSKDVYFDEVTRSELLSVENDEKEIEESYNRELEFGTGGLRGIIGAGTNRINRYTVAKATAALAGNIKSAGEDAARR